jgi:glycosyltransferase involved in cell wall biosynthesis
MRAALAEFDLRAAHALSDRSLRSLKRLIAFNGAALQQFRQVGRSGVGISLVSATAHISTVIAQHDRAFSEYPFERSWASSLRTRMLAEYERAEAIYVSSQRVRESFLAHGYSEERLIEFPLTPDPRFTAAREHESTTAFEVLYVGALSVVKGVPLLVDAVARLAHRDVRLVLNGGWGTRGMRRFIERACARDPRVTVELGDPLQRVQRASLYVHPSYDDGFGYAAAEALAAGVPVVVTEDTGMKDLVEPGRNGVILASGETNAITEAIDAAYRGELLRG